MKRVKSIFASKTFWSAVLTCGVGLNPVLVKVAENGKFTPADAGAIVSVVLGAVLTIYFRTAAIERIYTPDGLPGPNKSDFAGY